MAIAVEAPAREDLSFRDNDDKLVGARWLKSDGTTPMVIVSAGLAIEFDPPLPSDQSYVDARVFLPPETHIITSTTPGDPDGWINPTGLSVGVVLVTVPHGVWAAYATRSGRWDIAAVADDGTQRCLVRGLFHVEPGVATPTAPGGGGGGGSPTPFIISVAQTAPADFTFNTDEVPTTRAGHQNQWDFGDGATATEVVGVEVDHSYDTGGDYTITCYCHGYTATIDVTATVASGTVLSDDFNRPDSDHTTQFGPLWDRVSQNDWSWAGVLNNEATEVQMAQGYNVGYVRNDFTPLDPTKVFSEIDYLTNSAETKAPIICHDGRADIDGGYGLWIQPWNPNCELIRTGNVVANFPGPAADPTRWIRLRLERDGNVVRTFVDGVEINAWTDPSPLTGTGIGFGYNNGGARLDNWSGGDASGSGRSDGGGGGL